MDSTWEQIGTFIGKVLLGNAGHSLEETKSLVQSEVESCAQGRMLEK